MSPIDLLLRAGLLACCTAAIPAVAQTGNQDTATPPPGFTAPPRDGAQRFVARFLAANTTGDGHLTLAQAEAGHLPMIARNFAAIDGQHKGYVTLPDIRAWRRQMRAARDNSANATQ